jgi:peptide/nickel transport system substrate-binding protein
VIDVRRLAVIVGVGLSLILSTPALAQKHGGVLHIEHIDSPPSASIHEEGTAHRR